MQIIVNFYNNWQCATASIFVAFLSLFMVACTDIDEFDGAAIEARSQTISFSTTPILKLDNTANTSATASSGLVVRFSSTTPDVCSTNSSGHVTAMIPGDCIIAANQSGNTTYAPATQVTQTIPVVFDPDQTIIFDTAPTLGIFSTATVSAAASSGLAVSYSSTTAVVCTVMSDSGLVTALTLGDCIIAANQAGDNNYNVAPQVIQTITVFEPVVITEPGAPTEVTVTAENISTIIVSFGATDSGGSVITGYTINSNPPGILGAGTESPVSVSCPSSCAGYAFSVTASNAIGDSEPSVLADVITDYNIIETFYEPQTFPRDSIFIGTFTFNATTATVTNLRGILSESMTGDAIAYPHDNMIWLPLNHQLSSVYDPVLGGLLVTTFLHSNTNTLAVFSSDDDGWSPGTGFALHFDFDPFLSPSENVARNPGNAYAMIFVNTQDPTAPLTQNQIDKLAYADCAPGGMMGSTCMTGTTQAGYGVLGSMDGYPVSQIITKQP